MDQELAALLSDNRPSSTLFREAEDLLARVAARELLTPSKTRASLWIPAARILLNKVGGDDAEIMRYVEETLADASNYNKSNLGMEIIRTAVVDKHPMFDWPSFYAASLVYDPFIKGAVIPPFESLKRIFLDTNVNLKEIESLFTTELTEEQLEVKKHFTIPQAIPGLGFLIMQPQYGICSLSDLSSTLEKLNGNKHEFEVPSIKANFEILSLWATNVADKLRIRILLVNLSSNLENPQPLIKYKPETVDLDMRSRKHIITSALIEGLMPFEFPPPTLGGPGTPESEKEGSFFSDDPNRSYKLFGRVGPMYVVLDYCYGEKRYLLLSRSRTQVELPPESMPSSLRFMGPTSMDDDLRTVIGMQHFRFMSMHIPFYASGLSLIEPTGSILQQMEASEQRSALIIPSRGAIQFEKPLPGTDVFSAGYNAALLYMKQFLRAIDLNRPPLESLPKTDSRLRIAYQTMFSDKMQDAIKADIADNQELFSPESESAKILNIFEAHFLGLQK
jgi:hypothetical protein